MDRRQLEQWLNDGLSLAEIATLVDRDPSTVGYWCRKHGLRPNGRAKHAPRRGLPRDELAAQLGSGATLRAIADAFGVSQSTVRHWIGRYGLPTARTQRRSDVQRALLEGRRTVQRECPSHGLTIFVIENSGRTRCRRCRIERVAEHRRRVKAILVREGGGRCVLCGYDRCMAALQFHHVDPATKSFALSLRGITRSIDALRAEARKCVVLCANCHAEVEAGFARLDGRR